MEEDSTLSEEDRRALRGSKFAPLPAPPPPTARSHHRLAHPGGPITTNKASALAKFLERKLQQPGGLDSIDPNLLELAVKNAKETVISSNSGPSSSGRAVRHVPSFHESSEDSGDQDAAELKQKETKKRKKKNKNRKTLQSAQEDKSVKRKLKKKKKEDRKSLKKQKP